MDIKKVLNGLDDIMNIVVGHSAWLYTTGTFTGAFHDRAGNRYEMIVPEGVVPYSYEIRYRTVQKGELSYWHIFDPGVIPDPAALAGTPVRLKYDSNDPRMLKVLND